MSHCILLLLGIACGAVIAKAYYDDQIRQLESTCNEMLEELHFDLEPPPLLTDEARAELRAHIELEAAIFAVNEGITEQ